MTGATGKQLALSLLRVVQSPEEQTAFSHSKVLAGFVTETNIGELRGSRLVFRADDKEKIRAWLRADRIDPMTPPASFGTMSRAEAIGAGPDEKWAGKQVRTGKVAIKTRPGRPLLLDGREIWLPAKANVELSIDDSDTARMHQSVVVVENWLCFEEIGQLQINWSRAGENPLIVWRGGDQVLRADATMEFLQRLGAPVWSAPDYDPAGLAIAARLPELAGVLMPNLDVLRELLGNSRLADRYRIQLPGAARALDEATNQDIALLWDLIRQEGRALPQEKLLRLIP